MKHRLLFSLVVLSLVHVGVQANDNAQLSLASLADFPIGAAVPADPWPNSLMQSPQRQALMEQHFDSLTAENAMKMAYLQPAPG